MPLPPSMAETDAELTGPGGPFEIRHVEIAGVPTKVWAAAPATLAEILGDSRRHGERTFLVYGDEQLSFEEHFRSSAQVAHVLREGLGVAKGDRVAIAMRNYPEWSLAFWGVAAASGVAVALNAWWTGEELQYALADSGATVLLADRERAERILPYADRLPDLHTIVVARPGPGRLPDSLRAWGDVFPGAAPAIGLPPVEVGPDDDATIFYTSGTVGQPKGVQGSHRNICTNPVTAQYIRARTAARGGTQAAPAGEATEAAEANTYLLSVPFFHATGCHSLLVGNLFTGTRMIVMHRWDPARALELIEQERVTSFGGVPTMVLQVLDHPDLGRRDVSSVRSVRYGGAPAPPELPRRIHEAFGGAQPMNGYGMTETSALTAMNAGPDYLAHPDSVGVPVPVVDIRIVDETGSDRAAGEVGELWIRGPNVVAGYWKRAAATAEAFSDGWVHTGDLARVDGDGFLYILDRPRTW